VLATPHAIRWTDHALAKAQSRLHWLLDDPAHLHDPAGRAGRHDLAVEIA